MTFDGKIVIFCYVILRYVNSVMEVVIPKIVTLDLTSIFLWVDGNLFE